MLSTTALSATFPFAGGDLPTGSGLLYGVNTATRSPVIVDRFALENHNAVVFATSGAGKSFLVKVELARAILAGTRVIVIDPEGEYARLVASLGGEVIAIRPGSQAGLDPFAVTNTSPGALTTRIATLTTFLDLLAGPLGPRQRAEVEDAISLAFAKAGFADGESVDDLTWPRLADVAARLRTNRATEDIAVRLERYVGGAGRWLFNQSAAAASSSTGSAAYVLAGLPEEERTPAMFLVLDRVWSRLADSMQPTLVVVDEAWWLMRHRETAAFLFRLVKTSRKRRAGLTLITQDVGDVLASPDGEPMIANSALQILMKQAPQAIPRLAELFRLTPAEQSWLLNAQRGEGLLVARGKRVPFQVIATHEESRLIEGNESRI
jgi:type IV secretory pathway VirB4 component